MTTGTALMFFGLLLPFSAYSNLSPTVQISPFLDKRQSALTLPDCGQNCYTLALPEIGTCNESDTACLCQDQSFMTQADQCFKTACSSTDLSTVIALGQQICQAAGTTLFQVSGLADNLNLPSVSAGVSTPTTLFSLPGVNSSTAAIPASTPAPTNTTSTSLATPSIATSTPTSTYNKATFTNQPIKPSVFSVASSLDMYCTSFFLVVIVTLIILVE